MVYNMKRLAEAIVNGAFVKGKEYNECRYCLETGHAVLDIEHDSECPVLLAEQILKQ